MAERTSIEWVRGSDGKPGATWNPITGCSVISPGCTNCYAMRLAGTRMKSHPSRAGLTTNTKAGPVWNGQVRLNLEWLNQPLQWKRPRMIFVCAHADLFHEGVPDKWIDHVFAVMALAPQHRFQVLTKRSARMRDYMEKSCGRIADRIMALRRETGIGKGNAIAPLPHGKLGAPWFPLENVWLGVSAEDQRRANERIPDLLATPAAIRWLSAEPLLGPLSLETIDTMNWPRAERLNALTGELFGILGEPGGRTARLDWIVAGGESGPGARPMHPDWPRSLRDQCHAAGVPFLFKQWGEFAPVCAMDEAEIDACYHPPKGRDPEAARREKLESIIAHRNGEIFRGAARYQFGAHLQGSGSMLMFPIGKARAGRLLDGVEHNGFPVIEGQQ